MVQIATLEDGAVGFRGISTPRTGGCIEFAFIEVGEEIYLNRILMDVADQKKNIPMLCRDVFLNY